MLPWRRPKRAPTLGNSADGIRVFHLEIRRLQRHANVPRRNKRDLSPSRVPLPEHESERSGEQSPTGKFRNGATPHAIVLAKRLGLRYVTSDALSIRRTRRGRGWIYIGHNQHPIRDPKIIRRLARLAVPPAYADVLYAADPHAHLQAVGRDAAGRLQYRYHSRWKTCANCARAAVLPG